MTNEQRAAWLKGRRTGIGGSDVAREFRRFLTSLPIRKLRGRLQISTERLSILRLREKFGRY